MKLLAVRAIDVAGLDRALRNTRVLVRRVAVGNYRREALPGPHFELCRDLADAADAMADTLAHDEMAEDVRDSLLRIGEITAEVERSVNLSAEVVLAQIRSIVVDLLQITGLDVVEATDALPPARR